MRAHSTSRRVRPGVLAAIAAAAFATAAASGATPSSPAPASQLRAANTALAAQSRSAALNLYAIESRLTRARTQLGALRARQAELEREQASVRVQRRIATRALHVGQLQLAMRLRALYEQGNADPIAVILGAQSLDEAVTRLDELDSSAAQDRDVIAQTLDARRRLLTLERRLARDEAQVRSAAAAAAATAAQLAGARDSHRALIATLARRRRLNSAAIAKLEAAARAAETQAAAVNAHAAAPASAAPQTSTATAVPATVGGTLTVTATGYALTGHTATGVPVGWGVVAVDPSVIPLGTHLTIPGYGSGVAADTGGAVHGATIDLWFPSQAQALAWGRRVVTITLR